MFSIASRVRIEEAGERPLARGSAADLAYVLRRERDGATVADLLVTFLTAVERLDLDGVARHPCAAVNQVSQSSSKIGEG
jgi:hypothetical protein